VTADKHPCLVPVGHGKFAVLIVADRRQLRYQRAAMCRFKFAVLTASNMLDLRYRRILTKLKINNNTATAKAVAVVLHQKTAVKLHSGFYAYLFS